MKRNKCKLLVKQIVIVILMVAFTTSLIAGCKNKSTKEKCAVSGNETTGIERESSGKVLDTTKYSEIYEPEHQGEYTRVKNDGKWGVVDADSNLVIPCEYDKIAPIPYIYTITSAMKNGKAYIISLGDGEKYRIIEAGRYSDISKLILGRFFQIKNKKGKKGLLQANGSVLLKPRYKKIDVKQQDEYIYKIITTDFDNNEQSWLYEGLEMKIYKEM